MPYSCIDVFPVTRGVTFKWGGCGFAEIFNRLFSRVPRRQAFTYPMRGKAFDAFSPHETAPPYPTNSMAQAPDVSVSLLWGTI